MLGKPTIIWEAKDMIRGMSTSDDLADGGFSPNTDAMNLTTTPGVMYSPASPTDKSTSLTGDMMVSVENSTTLTAVDRIFLATDSSSSDGSYYYWNGTALTLKRTDSTNNYNLGKSAVICFANEFYGTSNEAITRWTADDATFNVSFFTFNDTFAPHPAIVFEGNAFYGDGNLLLRQTAGGGATPSTIMTLTVGTTITAFGIDPGSGKMLISTTTKYNISDTLSETNKVLYYDGFSNKALKSVIVDEMITSFYNVQSTTYVFYAQNIGYWNGAGIKFLRKLDLAFNNEVLSYPQHVTNIESTLYVTEKTRILAYGPIKQGGNNVWYPVYKNNVNTNNITLVVNLGQKILGIGFKDEKFYTLDTSSITSSNTQTFFSDKYALPGKQWVRRVQIFYSSQVNNGATTGSLTLFDENGALASFGNAGLVVLTNTSGAANAFKEIDNINVKVNQLQWRLISEAINPGIRRIIFYCDPADIT